MKSNRNNRAPAPAAAARPHMSVAKKLMVISLCTLATVMAVLSAAIGYAYFTKEEVYDAYFGIQVGELFDKLEPEALEDYQTRVLGGSANSSAEWGTKENPYVISKSKHLYNLSQLQNVGYFERLYISENTFNNGVLDTTQPIHMPYFLVCEPDGTPVCIEGGDEKIKPIGTEDYPFIGSVKGAFVKGEDVTCTIPPADGTGTGLVSTESVIHNVQVIAPKSTVDVGLFGHISCLGDPATADANGSFSGYISEVTDLVLSDVSIIVDDSLWDAWVSVVDHIFSYSDFLDIAEGEGSAYLEQVPHETNHIGIMAGHVTFSKVEFISVYYSSEDHLAIDLSHAAKKDGSTAANYMSGTGIIGFMDGLNPTVNAEGEITENTGTDSGGLVTGTPESGGGGAGSGLKRGYMVASYIYDTFNTTSNGTGNFTDIPGKVEGTRYITELYRHTTKEEREADPTLPEYVSLCVGLDGDGNVVPAAQAEKCYFYDGVFTFAASSSNKDVLAPTWNTLDASGNAVADVFAVGENDSALWKENTQQGSTAIVAYVTKLKSNAELQAALDAGKQIFISQDSVNADGDTILTMMSLYGGSQTAKDGTPDQKYFTAATNKAIDNSQREELAEAYRATEQKMDENGPVYDANGDPVMEYALPVPEEWKSSWMHLHGKTAGTMTETDEEACRQALIDALADGTLDIINVGATSSTNTSLEVIQQQYKIYADEVEDNFQYFLHGTSTPVTMTGDDIFDILQYTQSEYADANHDGVLDGGYFYVTHTMTQDVNDTYTYYWYSYETNESIPLDYVYGDDYYSYVGGLISGGETDGIGVSASDSPLTAVTVTNDDQTTSNVRWAGANIYQWTNNGVTYQGVLLNQHGTEENDYVSALHNNNSGGVSATATVTAYGQNEIVCTTTTSVSYFVRTEGTSTWVYSENTNLTTDATPSPLENTTTDGGLQMYSVVINGTTCTGILVDKYPTYTLSSEPADGHTLFALSLSYGWLWANYGTYFPLWSGTTSKYDSENFTHSFSTGSDGINADKTGGYSTNAVVKFAADGLGSCYIQYTVGNATRYVAKSTSATHEPIFSATGDINDPNAKLCIYAVEGTQDTTYGRITFDPADGSDGDTYAADEYVLYAQSSQSTTSDPTYYNDQYLLKSLQELGWKDDEGNILETSDLKNKLGVTEGLKWGLSIDFWFIDYDTPGIVTAPVGNAGVEANIPQGCVAFRVNADMEGNTIRVIVAVPVSEYYPGEHTSATAGGAYVPGEYRTYFNMWKMDDSGSNPWQAFDPAAPEDRFYLPSSHPYEPGTAAADNKYITVYKEADASGTAPAENATPYRSYLNGDRVLVAYEFEATEQGIYALGAIGYNPNGEAVSVPMEVVYISSAGIASEGRDGENNSQLGTIDFVYDNGTQIMAVTETSETFDHDNNPETPRVEDPTCTYYPTYAILFFDNRLAVDPTAAAPDFIDINKAEVRLRRYINIADDGTTTTVIACSTVLDDDLVSEFGGYVKFNTYARYCDTIILTQSPPNPTS